MNTKFTKGEWIVDGAGDVIIKGSDGGVGFPARDGTIASLNDGEYIENTNEFDAHLIAAAPDMYAMLEGMYETLCLIGDDGEEANEIDGLLKKARGEHE